VDNVGGEEQNVVPPAVQTVLPFAASALPSEDRAKSRRKASKPKESTVALYLRVPASVARNLKLAAVAEDITMSDIVSRMLEQHLGTWVAPYRKSA
jgi:hypothetical protein